MKAFYKIITVAFLAWMIAGCSQKSMAVSQSDAQLINDTKKAYVVFSWPKDKFYNKNTLDIVELNQAHTDFKFVGVIELGTKIIYEVTPGSHYFYAFGDAGLIGMAMPWLKDDHIEVNTVADHIYFVHVGSKNLTNPNLEFKEYDASIDASYSKVVGEPCSKEFLTTNGFVLERWLNEDQTNVIESDRVAEYKSSQLGITIWCENSVIKRPDNYMMTIEKLMAPATVTPVKEEIAYMQEHQAEYVERLKSEYRLKVEKNKSQKVINKKQGIVLTNMNELLSNAK